MIELSSWLFWDIDRSTFSYEKHANFIIVRALERGGIEDIRKICRHYGMEKCREAVTTTKYMDYRTIIFCCTLFGLKKEDFRCYKLRLLNPGLYDY